MHLFYIFALAPVFVGLGLWIFNKRIVLCEWLAMSAAGFIVAGLMHLAAIKGMTDDIETWSGYVTRTIHCPEWVEQYEQMHTQQVPTGTDSNGNTTYTTLIYWTTEYDTHRENWSIIVNFGQEQNKFGISEDKYNSITQELGGKILTGTRQKLRHGGKYYKGDFNTYLCNNTTGFIRPITQTKSFENRIKAAPSIFSFVQVGTNVPVHSYPANNNPFVSDRLLGDARGRINQLKFDQLNARIGPLKKVNLIMVGFSSSDTSLGEYQRAKWLNGKKNDIVLTYGIEGSKVKWAKVFGWSDSEICKRNLETVLLKNPINDSILPLIEEEIKSGYKLKNWSEFDYLSIEPRFVHFVCYFIIMGIIQGGLIYWFNVNEFDKECLTSSRLYANLLRNARQRH